MLTELRLGNFKAFADVQRIPLRPLTLIFGPNSSGKSSLIHSLAFAYHAMKTGELDVHRTTIGGDSIDLGGFNQYVHRRNIRSTVELAFTISKDNFTARLKELLPEVNILTIGVTIALTQRSKSLKELIDVFFKDVLKETSPFKEENFKKAIHQAFGEFTPKQVEEFLLSLSSERGDRAKEEAIKKLSTNNDFLTYIEQSTLEGKVHVETFGIEVDEKPILSMSYRPEGFLQLDSLHNEHQALLYIIKSTIQSMTTTDTVENSDFESAAEAINELVPQISFSLGNLFPDKLREEKSEQDLFALPPILPIGKGSRKEDIKNAISLYLPRIIKEIVNGCSSMVEQEIGCLNYLGPLRSYPPRHIAFSQYHDPNWQAGGGYAWDTVRTNTEVRSKVNDWLGDTTRLSTPYELRIRNLLSIEDIESKWGQLTGNFYEDMYSKFESGSDNAFFWAEDFVSQLPDKLKAIEPILSNVQDLALFDKRSNTLVSHRDVGIGISQVLPVLVSAYAARNKIVAIEQPEIHLHPRLQAELGDVFINAALGESSNAFILETHSEHLILRIMKRIRETTQGKNKNTPQIKPEDVALLYIEDSKAGSVVRLLRIDDKGRLIDSCPGGFFEEGFDELF